MNEKLKIWQAYNEHPEYFNIKDTLIALESAIDASNAGLAIGLCKSLIESFCYGFIDAKGKRNIIREKTPTLKTLITKTCNLLKIVPDELKDKTEANIKNIINIHISHIEKIVNLTENIGSIRNDFCPVSHGRAHWFIDLDTIHSNYIVNITDNMLFFIYNLIDFYKDSEKLDYQSNELSNFNEFIDSSDIISQNNTINIQGSIFNPSQILYELEYETYRIQYQEYEQNKEEREKNDNN